MVGWPERLHQPLAQVAEAAEQSQTLMERLSPLNQIRVVTGLFVVLVLGLFLFLVIKAGSHMVKGFSAAANRLPSDSTPQEDDWAKKPLNEAASNDVPTDEATGNGVPGDPNSDEG